MGGSGNIGKRIVIPLDGSALAERALPYARAIAAGGGEMVLVRVTPLAENAVSGGDDAHLERIVGIAAKLRADDGLRVDVHHDHGDPAIAIPRLARKRGADLIVLAGEGWRAPSKRYQGSVGDRVAREAVMSVLVVRSQDAIIEAASPARPVPIRRVVVPLDGSARAMAVLPAAARLAERCGASVWLVAAVDPAYGTPPAAVADAARETRDALAEQLGEAQKMIEGAGARIMRDGGIAAWRVLEGPAADAIVGAARAGDLIVIASRGRGGAGGWPLGSVAEKVVRYSPVPVLVHRAEPES